ENKLASFLGVFLALSGIIGLIANTMFSGRLLNRFGMSFGLLILPLALILGVQIAAISYAIFAVTAIFFGLIISTKILDNVGRDSLESPTMLLLYQPMPANRRAHVQRLLETAVDPIASIGVGLLLLFLTSILSWQTLDLAYLLLLIISGWIFASILLRQKYTDTLMNALSHRSFSGEALSLDDSESTAILAKRLTSHVPGEVIYCLNMLEEIQHESLENFMLKLLSSESDQVRMHVIERIGMLGMINAMPHIRKMLQHKQTADMTASLLQTMCALDDGDMFDEIIPWLDHTNSDIRTGVIIGMLRSGGIDGVLAAGSHLNRLLIATDPDERCMAAYILGKVGTSAFYRPLVKLMQDKHLSVRRTAIRATVELHNLRLLPTLLEQLQDHQTRELAAISIAAYGVKALEDMKNLWPKANNDLRLRMVRIFGGMRNEAAMSFLWEQLLLSHVDKGHTMSLIDALLQALIICRYQVDDNEQKYKQVLALMQQEIQRTIWALTTMRALSALETSKTAEHIIRLCAALEREVQHCRLRIFDLLALILPCENVLNAKINYLSNFIEKRAYSIEVIDNLINGEMRQNILILLDDMQINQRLLSLNIECFGQEQGQLKFDAALMTECECIKNILSQMEHMCLPWTISSALYMVAKHKDNQFSHEVKVLLTHKNELVRETAVWALACIAPFDALKSIQYMISDVSSSVALVARKVFIDLMTPVQRKKLTVLLRKSESSGYEDIK
ncbi:MAG: HEAT repeat domain-containing protein, partial [Mariprofundales bacterium]